MDHLGRSGRCAAGDHPETCRGDGGDPNADGGPADCYPRRSLHPFRAGCELPDYARNVERGRGTGERNFLPFIPWLAQRARVATFPCTDPREAIGINTPEELRRMEEWMVTR